MHHMSYEGDAKTALELVEDIFKILKNGYVEANNTHGDKINNDLLPKCKNLCEEPALETKSLGVNLEDKVKKTNSMPFCLFFLIGDGHQHTTNQEHEDITYNNTSSGNYPLWYKRKPSNDTTAYSTGG